MLKLGWLSTGRGEGSRELLRLVHDQIASGDLPATIQFVFSNREQSEAEGSDQFQALVRSYGLPLVTLSSQRFRRERGARSFDEVREEFDQETMKRLEGFEPDLCVLAGYMLFTAREFCERYTLINIHPAPPNGPLGTWQEVIWQLIQQRASEAGAQIQLATIDWDRGPIITYCTFPTTGPLFDPLWEQAGDRSLEELKSDYREELPLFQRIRGEGLKRETPLLLETIRAFSQGKVKVVDRQVTDEKDRPISGRNLNSEIEAWLEKHGEG